VLYIGDGTDLIDVSKKAVAVEFTNLPDNSPVTFGSSVLCYSAELSSQGGATYVGIVPASATADSLDDIDSYLFPAGQAQPVNFADMDADGHVNAADALGILSLWLRKAGLGGDKDILTANASGDGRIDTVDVLAVVESIVDAKPLPITLR
jgi:hypothetical protein